jgi:hypothetical protein
MEAVVQTDVPPSPPRKPWRLRHPRVARAILYGGFLALGAAGAVVAARVREDARQQGLLTRIHGVEMVVRATDGELALKILREDVLAQRPDDDVRRRAMLSEASVLDSLRRFDESEAAYARIASEWPGDRPRGALTLPWANMRVRAGRPAEALALLEAAGATEGEAPEDVQSIREAARRVNGRR